jgi:2-polyprenyl-3-methyl-5-hydroxy-6-metoxy-1,4-benzoquinol methylase
VLSRRHGALEKIVETEEHPRLLRHATGGCLLSGLDIGCGDGHNTRLLARRGVRVTAVDIAEVFIRHAKQCEEQEPLGIQYRVASAVAFPFADARSISRLAS